MPDNITYSTDPAGVPGGTVQVTDVNASTHHMPVFKLAVSADASTTLIPATTAGVLVALSSVNQVQGDVAHDSTDTGAIFKVGGRAVSFAATPTPVAADDRTHMLFSRHGVPWFLGGHPNIKTIEYSATAAATNSAIVTAAGTSERIVATAAMFVCDEVNTTAVQVRIGFSTATTPTTTGVFLTHPGLVPGAGVVRGDGSGIIGIGAGGESPRITHEIPTDGAVRAILTYFTIQDS